LPFRLHCRLTGLLVPVTVPFSTMLVMLQFKAVPAELILACGLVDWLAI
jgi:hypothetical protein